MTTQLIDCIGNTPLIRLNRLSDETGCEILGKAEFMNPGGSVKDRAALGMVRAALDAGELKPGGVIVEGTAGNTGIGLAMVGNALGHRTVIVMPDNQSLSKITALRAFGAEVKLIPAVPFKNPNHFVHTSARLAGELNETEENGAFWANQFDNVTNREFHEQTTGPEIWEQTGESVDGFICAAGTGGTLGGVGRALKARNPDVTIGLSDPGGSGLHHYYAHGEIAIEGSSITEGIGNSRITENLAGSPIDISWQIPDTDAIPAAFDLVRDEGLVLGGSSGINVMGAVRLARELGRGHTIVTILCDSMLRYQERMLNRDFLESKGLSLPAWLDL
jgi:cysteine synthase A